MSTFGAPNAKADAASVSKNNPTADDIKTADGEGTDGQQSIPSTDPQEPTNILDESADEAHDRHVASTEIPAGDVTDPETQGDSPDAKEAASHIVPGAASGPDDAGVVRNDHGKVAYAPPGSTDAAFNGVQQDASGHVDSVGTDNSDRSNTRT